MTAKHVVLDAKMANWHVDGIEYPENQKYSEIMANEQEVEAGAANKTTRLPSRYGQGKSRQIGMCVLDALCKVQNDLANVKYANLLCLETDKSRCPQGEGKIALERLSKKGDIRPGTADVTNYTFVNKPSRGANCATDAEKVDVALCYLEGRVRSGRGYEALAHVDNLAKGGNPLAIEVQQMWKAEGIVYKPPPDVHREPGNAHNHDRANYVMGKAGPMIGFVHPNTGKVVYQAQDGHYMRLGVKSGAKNVYANVKFWRSNAPVPVDCKSAWLASGTGKIQEVWFSCAATAEEEEERAIKENRPIYQLFSNIEDFEKMDDIPGQKTQEQFPKEEAAKHRGLTTLESDEYSYDGEGEEGEYDDGEGEEDYDYDEE